jgi:hypothetical protein
MAKGHGGSSFEETATILNRTACEFQWIDLATRLILDRHRPALTRSDGCLAAEFLLPQPTLQ